MLTGDVQVLPLLDLYFLGHGGREKESLSLSGEVGEYRPDVLLEAHVYHPGDRMLVISRIFSRFIEDIPVSVVTDLSASSRQRYRQTFRLTSFLLSMSISLVREAQGLKEIALGSGPSGDCMRIRTIRRLHKDQDYQEIA